MDPEPRLGIEITEMFGEDTKVELVDEKDGALTYRVTTKDGRKYKVEIEGEGALQGQIVKCKEAFKSFVKGLDQDGFYAKAAGKRLTVDMATKNVEVLDSKGGKKLTDDVRTELIQTTQDVFNQYLLNSELMRNLGGNTPPREASVGSSQQADDNLTSDEFKDNVLTFLDKKGQKKGSRIHTTFLLAILNAREKGKGDKDKFEVEFYRYSAEKLEDDSLKKAVDLFSDFTATPNQISKNQFDEIINKYNDRVKEYIDPENNPEAATFIILGKTDKYSNSLGLLKSELVSKGTEGKPELLQKAMALLNEVIADVLEPQQTPELKHQESVESLEEEDKENHDQMTELSEVASPPPENLPIPDKVNLQMSSKDFKPQVSNFLEHRVGENDPVKEKFQKAIEKAFKKCKGDEDQLEVQFYRALVDQGVSDSSLPLAVKLFADFMQKKSEVVSRDQFNKVVNGFTARCRKQLESLSNVRYDDNRLHRETIYMGTLHPLREKAVANENFDLRLLKARFVQELYTRRKGFLSANITKDAKWQLEAMKRLNEVIADVTKPKRPKRPPGPPPPRKL